MEKFSRNSRVSAITKFLIENPNEIITLNVFTERFNAAKSTISEDLVIIKDTLERLGLGRIETISGAAGGIKYIGGNSKEENAEFVESVCNELKNRERVIPGNFLYLNDIMYDPKVIYKSGVILASNFMDVDVDYVVTVETKGIPLAYEVARGLGVELVVVRRDNKVTEGPTVSINYISGSSRRIQTMSLARRAIKRGSKCIFIDDFMKAGGTALGIIDLLKEFDSEVTGIGVLIDNVKSEKKLVENYVSLINFNGINEDGVAIVHPSN